MYESDRMIDESDSTSTWLECIEMNKINAVFTIKTLRKIYVQLALRLQFQIVPTTTFMSNDFQFFVRKTGSSI